MSELRIGRGFWALADQCVVSLGTFLTNIVLARSLPQGEYGAYCILFGVLLLLNGVHFSVVTYPLSVKGAVIDSAGLRRHTGGSLILTIVLAVPSSLGLLAATFLLGRASLLWWGFVALVLWQVQETLRRGLMARLSHGQAVWGDTFSYLGQAGCLWAISRTGLLTLELTFGVIALTSGLAAAVQASQIGVKFIALAEIRDLGRESWHLGRWVLLANGLNILSIQSLFWALAIFHGPKESASLQAVANPLGATHPILFGLANLIVPAAARANRAGGRIAAWRCTRDYGLLGGALMLPYFVTLLLWPRAALELFYGAGSPYVTLESALRLFVLAYLVTYAAQVLGSFLNGLRRTKAAFLTQLSGGVTGLILGLPLIVYFGVGGACAGFLAANITRAGACAIYAVDERKAPSPFGDEAQLRLNEG